MVAEELGEEQEVGEKEEEVMEEEKGVVGIGGGG